jgi:hypothetical protein
MFGHGILEDIKINHQASCFIHFVHMHYAELSDGLRMGLSIESGSLSYVTRDED